MLSESLGISVHSLSSERSLGRVFAHNRLILLNTPDIGQVVRKPYQVVAQIPVEANVIPLRNFIAAVLVISKAAPDYRLLKTQCYHFALVFCRLILGKEQWLSVKGKILASAGKCCGVEIVSDTAVEEWATKFQSDYEEKLLYVSRLKSDAEREEELAREREAKIREAARADQAEADNQRLRAALAAAGIPDPTTTTIQVSITAACIPCRRL